MASSDGPALGQWLDVQHGAAKLPDWAAQQPSVLWLRAHAGAVSIPCSPDHPCRPLFALGTGTEVLKVKRWAI